jgi:hypothetical protein
MGICAAAAFAASNVLLPEQVSDRQQYRSVVFVYSKAPVAGLPHHQCRVHPGQQMQMIKCPVTVKERNLPSQFAHRSLGVILPDAVHQFLQVDDLQMLLITFVSSY